MCGTCDTYSMHTRSMWQGDAINVSCCYIQFCFGGHWTISIDETYVRHANQDNGATTSISLPQTCMKSFLFSFLKSECSVFRIHMRWLWLTVCSVSITGNSVFAVNVVCSYFVINIMNQFNCQFQHYWFVFRVLTLKIIRSRPVRQVCTKRMCFSNSMHIEHETKRGSNNMNCIMKIIIIIVATNYDCLSILVRLVLTDSHRVARHRCYFQNMYKQMLSQIARLFIYIFSSYVSTYSMTTE